MASVRLGRRAVKRDSRTLLIARYFTEALPPAPATADWTKGITSFGMMLNDQLGDCTIAGVGHAVQVWTANVGTEVTVPDSTILSYYESWDGYVDGDPSTDNGGIELDVLNDWRQQGFDGHKLIGYADANVSDPDQVRQAIYLFGGVYIGMEVPNFIMTNGAPDPSVTWDVVADDGGIAGGHCVFCAGYDANTITFISWGQVYKMTNAFWQKYVDEAHACLSSDWLSSASIDPSGVDLAQLQADLALIK